VGIVSRSILSELVEAYLIIDILVVPLSFAVGRPFVTFHMQIVTLLFNFACEQTKKQILSI
jgi:hypothetical protein